MTQPPHPRTLLRFLFDTAVQAAHPKNCLPAHLPELPGRGRLIVLACGKAATAMAQTVEDHYIAQGRLPAERVTGLVVTRHGFSLPLRHLPLREAGHPVPDAAGLEASMATLAVADDAGPDDTVLVLLSGGASALWTAPVSDLDLIDKQSLTKSLLASGAPIGEINCVRRHLSQIKGGRLAARLAPARHITLAISDVPGNLPTAIGSGPTVGDPSTLEEARAILTRYGIDVPGAILRALTAAENETPKPGDPVFAQAHFELVATGQSALEAAGEMISDLGYRVHALGDGLEGEARELAKQHAELALTALARGEKTALLSGGEATVTVKGNGQGGPNQEYALALAIALAGASGITALAADTDGTDGGTGKVDDPAGAFVFPDTLARTRANQRNPATFLDNNDSTGFFKSLDDLLVTGPTQTNVNDFRLILIDPAV